MTTESPVRTSPFLLAAAWAVVAVPLAWGVYETAIKSVPLFRPPAAAPAPAESSDQSAKTTADLPGKG